MKCYSIIFDGTHYSCAVGIRTGLAVMWLLGSLGVSQELLVCWIIIC
uniref:Uncharacterized protein n=1 Tax=Anguilla anguilla TaxID=7936 RepID=A0A0E9PAH1_ANGAN